MRLWSTVVSQPTESRSFRPRAPQLLARGGTVALAASLTVVFAHRQAHQVFDDIGALLRGQRHGRHQRTGLELLRIRDPALERRAIERERAGGKRPPRWRDGSDRGRCGHRHRSRTTAWHIMQAPLSKTCLPARAWCRTGRGTRARADARASARSPHGVIDAHVQGHLRVLQSAELRALPAIPAGPVRA